MELQTQEGITVRWDIGLNKKRIAYFQASRANSAVESHAHVCSSTSDQKPSCVLSPVMSCESSIPEVSPHLPLSRANPADAWLR